jgi:ADP-ribosyl-[dinitrogen reductase] hydrolase
MTAGPLPGTYWAIPDRLLAGDYPGAGPAGAERLAALLRAGCDYFIDLTWPDELPSYAELLPSPYDAKVRPVAYSRRPIRDHGVPEDPAHTVEILDEIETALAADRCVYLHCHGGIGRTGLIVGCLLARRLRSGERALVELDRLWHASGRDRDYPRSPETDLQCSYVLSWSEAPPAAPAPAGPGDRYRGLVLGLALGDALGVPADQRRGRPPLPVADPTGGGPDALPPGAWTDDTAIPLLLAEGLIERQQFDAADQLARLRRWQRDGYLSSTGRCVGITPATARALAQAAWTGKPYAGSHDPAHAAQEPLTRAGVAAAFMVRDVPAALELAVDCARLTHQAPLALDAVRYYTALLLGALSGAPAQELTAPNYSPVPGLWDRCPLKPPVAALAAGSWRARAGRPARTGTAVDGLALTLWAIHNHPSWREAVLAVVNLGYQAPTHGALVGQLAGAIYGAAGIPADWQQAVARRDLLESTADRLRQAATRRRARA